MTTRRTMLVAIWGLFLNSGLSGAIVRADLRSNYSGGTAYGNITLESKNPKQVYTEVLKICKELNAVIVSYSSYNQSPSNKIQISAQIQVDKDKGVDLMSRFSTLAEVRNQNISQNYSQNPDQIKKQLEDLNKELSSLAGSRYPILVGYGVQQRQSLQSQIQQMDSSRSFTTISLSIQEPNQGQTTSKLQSIELSSILFLVGGFTVGFILAKRLSAAKS